MAGTKEKIPEHLTIKQRFFTISNRMTIYDQGMKELYDIDCPAFRLKNNVYVYQAKGDRKLLFYISPIYGIEWNLMVCLPDDEIIGILQRRRQKGDRGPKCWYFIDAKGHEVLCIKPELSTLQRVRRWFSMFSFDRYRLCRDDQVAAIFEKHSGLVHGHYEIDLMPDATPNRDPLILLASCIALTGIFRMVFSRLS